MTSASTTPQPRILRAVMVMAAAAQGAPALIALAYGALTALALVAASPRNLGGAVALAAVGGLGAAITTLSVSALVGGRWRWYATAAQSVYLGAAIGCTVSPAARNLLGFSTGVGFLSPGLAFAPIAGAAVLLTLLLISLVRCRLGSA